jgi:outer membrane protein assembly factor BamD (BamD/ComL family)
MAYKMLRLEKLQQDSMRVLRLNFPKSRYFAEIEKLRAPPLKPASRVSASPAA